MRGFTLIELLIVIGVLAVLFAIVLIAINPLEQFNKTADVTTAAATQDISSATKYYFTTEKTLPWKKESSCKSELATGKTITDMPACAQELTKGGKLQQSLMVARESKEIFVTECNDAIALCYNPKSSQFNKTSEVKYTKNGALAPGCPNYNSTSADCYACSFTTNDAQECFNALNPKGSLALAPSPSPNQINPIPDRHSVKTCNTPLAGQASCLAEVVSSSGGTPFSSISVPAGFGPTQIHTAYNLPCKPGGTVQSTCDAPSTFGPRTIGIVDAFHSPTIETDLAMYNSTYGLPPCTIANGCLTIVNQNGTTSPMPPVDGNWALEAALDVQMAHAVCQTCKILLVEANDNSYLNLGIAVNRAATMGANAISNSYGGSDWSGSPAYDTYYTHPGIFITASSGDWGYGSYYPAASSRVISVGGTTLSLYANNTYATETVWSAGGSGCSMYQTASTYQTSLPNWSLTGCGTRRSIADVSAVADPRTGVAIYDTTPYGGKTGWWILGGTSASSPIISAALVLQELTAPTDAASYIYNHASRYRDVITGSTGSCGGKTACMAGVGYDGPTGMGSPNLLPPAGTSPTPILTPTNTPVPTSSPSATPTPTRNPCYQVGGKSLGNSFLSGYQGATLNQTITITNTGTTTCDFSTSYGFIVTDPQQILISVEGLPAWVTVAPGQTTTIPFSIKTFSNTAVGLYSMKFGIAGDQVLNGTVQVFAPNETPPSITCDHGWSSSLEKASFSGIVGDILNQSITVMNNNPVGCGSSFIQILNTIDPWSQISNPITTSGLPSSVTIPAGQSKTLPFTTTITPDAQIRDYTLKYWVGGQASPLMSAVVHVISPNQPTPTPTPVADTQAPAPVNTLTASISGTLINVNWRGSSDNVSVKEYRVYLDNSLITVANTYPSPKADDTAGKYGFGISYTANKTYEFYVRTVDTSDNYSAITQRVLVTTPGDGPANCLTQQTITLTQSQPISAIPGQIVNNTLTIKSNDTSGCSALYTISYSYPTGWNMTGIPASFMLSGGSTKTIPFTMTVPITNTAAGNYIYQFWVAKQGQSSVNPVNGSVQVTQGSPTSVPTPTSAPTATPTPTTIPTSAPTNPPINYDDIVPGYKIDQTKFFKTYAVYFFDYPGFQPSGAGWNMQISLRSDFAGDYTQQSNMFGIPSSYSQDAPLNVSYAVLRSITSKYVGFTSITSGYSFYNNGCGKTVYWRITNWYSPTATDKKNGPTYTGVIDCTTKVNVVDPPLSWYTVFDQGGTNQQKQYQASWDYDKNGVIDWTDYWLGAFSTKFRAGGWQPPE